MPIHDWRRVSAGVFHHFHTTWIPDLKRTLKRTLPPGFYAMIEQQAESAEDRFLLEPQIYAQTARHIAIRHVDGDQIVAVIEIVSPGNKQSINAVQAFVAKAVEWIQSGIHVLIVDLFPPTTQDPRGLHAKIWSEFGTDDLSPTPEQPLTLASYSAAELKEAFVQLATVGDELPEMPLFLEPGQYINLPLEPSYRSAFAEVPDHWQNVLK